MPRQKEKKNKLIETPPDTQLETDDQKIDKKTSESNDYPLDNVNRIILGDSEPNQDPAQPDQKATPPATVEPAGNNPQPVEEIVADIINGNTTSTEEIDPEFLNDFLVESHEHIEAIEMNVLALETDPDNSELIHSLFRSFHTIKGLAGFVNQDLIRQIAHQTETRLDKCRKGEIKVSKGFVDLILASSDLLKKICEKLELNYDPDFLKIVQVHLNHMNKESDFEKESAPSENVHGPEYQALKVDKLGEILVNQGVDPGAITDILEKQNDYPGLKLGQIVVKEKKAEAQDVIQSLRIQEKASKIITSDNSYNGYTRVPTLKIDNLVDLIGELVITQAQIEQEAIKRFGNNDSLVTNLIRMEKTSKDIQNISMSLRMISLKSTFQKINRIGRDTIAELHKNVNIEISGEETEIDRGVAERILDPLLHLLKNSISHGIEEETDRVNKGKPIQGQVQIQAYSKRGSVFIEISDDGKGMDVERIYQKAIDKGILDPSKIYTEDEILNEIFLPGFSTVENVNNVSGRGVGLDVVKTEISKLGGKVELDNQSGKGCRFTLKIPINMAVINGTIIDIKGVRYILPTLYIKQILKTEPDQWINISGNKSLIRIKDEVIPLISVDKLFGLPRGEMDDSVELVVVVELEQSLKALPVRNVVDRREIVVKALGREFSHLDYVSGASILGDGSVALILDIESLFKISA
ncbi:MAG TPA: hypothetical protein DDW65_10120 [Firmicutes bacterium]|nr:hypothetical protein [Bacillota bacterium]